LPGYKGHIAAALVLGAGGLALINWLAWFRPEPWQAAVLLGCIVLGALFPDVDTDSRGQKLFYFLLLIINLALMIMGHYRWAAILGFLAMLPVAAKHRGFIHTWWAMLIIPLAVFILPAVFYQISWIILLPFYLASVFGYFTHLLLDRQFA